MAHRIFIALKISLQNQTEIFNKITSPCRSKWTSERIKWTESKGYHATLQFIGDCQPEAITKLSEELTQHLEDIESFKLTLNRLGCFEKKKQGILWIGSSILPVSLKKILEAMSLPVETFVCHITLARGPLSCFENLADEQLEAMDIQINEVGIFESVNKGNGVQYIPIIVYHLHH